MNDSVYQLEKLKLVGFKGFVIMDVTTTGFIGPFSKHTIRWKKLRPFFNRGPEIFFPSTHYASLSQFFIVFVTA